MEKELIDEDGNNLGYVPTEDELKYYVDLDLPGDDVLGEEDAHE